MTAKTLSTVVLPATCNAMIDLQSYRGQAVVVFFYPKDNTPGCTSEACDFKSHFDFFRQHNIVVLGVSKDSMVSHEKFKTKLALPFDSVSDVDGVWCEHFGAWGEKKLYGKQYMGIIRTTVVIDACGNLIQSWHHVRVKDHVRTVIDYLTSKAALL
ncbi:MAG: peroxiredoxin [Coxiellaceae bacterium]|nr:peroxiredoxin [Coxiellaceae bacterium]